MLRFRYVPDRDKQRSRSEERPKSTSSSSSSRDVRFSTSPPPYHVAVATAAATYTPRTSTTSERCEDDGSWQDADERSSSAGTSVSDQGPDSMYSQHPSSRRRKKRPIHGVKTVQVTRGRSGYGFTISGQNPCVLSCIVGGSPADVAGLKAGDYLYVVNGINVSHAPHDDVVRMVGQSTGTLELQVAENYNSSDSSEDEYLPRSKSRYPNRVRFRQPHVEGAPPGIASRPLPQRPIDVKGSHGRLRNHVPVGAESDLSTSVTSPGSSLSEDRSRHDSAYGWRHPTYERIGRESSSRYASNRRRHAESTTGTSGTDISGEGFAFTTVQNGPVISTAKISSALSKRPQFHGQNQRSHQANGARPIPENDNVDVDGGEEAAGGAAGGLHLDNDADRENEDNMPPAGNEVRAIVGYIGSIELPGNVTRPNQRLQLLRNAVRRLRIEQKIHTLVLMDVSAEGVRLTSGVGSTIAHYSVEKLAFSGICPDDKRFFGIVTLHAAADDVSEVSGHPEERSPSSSCHVFMVDPDMCPHVLHCHKAKAFNLQCTPSPSGQRCQEFPQSPTQLILCIANLYRDRPRSKLDSDIIQSHAFADPSRPAERSSSNSSNSDSGLGFGREEGAAAEQVCIVDMPVGAEGNAAGMAGTPNISHSLASLQHHLSPGVHSITTPRGLQRPLSAFEVRRGLNNSSSSEECWMGMGRTDKLTPRAMPDPTTRNLPRAVSTDGLERNHSAENLRQSMQRLLQARQQRLQHDQTGSSDSESQTSTNVASHFSTRSAFQVPRPVSAPLRSRSRLQQVETVDMGFGKLSPRAFHHQPGNTIRSPSAPPIPYFPHQDSDDDDDDTESEDDPFVRRIISQFNKDRVLDFGEENPRRFSEGFALAKKREKERGEAEDVQRWTKTGSFRRSHNMKLKGNISQSHESLAVAEGDIIPGHNKLVTANSVNSILHQTTAPFEESGRVAGWAVGFQRLVADPAGLSIFTEFLKKEFSQENIEFWSAVEGYRQISDEDTRRRKAREIFNNHLGSQASDPVNVDSMARQCAEKYLDNPTPTMFDVAQQQIFHLMRQDSYVRFLKSDLYKGHLMREMEGQPLAESNTDGPAAPAPENKKKGKGKENEEKRRRSILPWRQNKKSSVKTSSDSALKGLGKIKEKDDKKEKEVNNNLKKAPGPGIDLSTMRKEVFNPKEVDKPVANEQFKFCRVVMPDGSTTVVCTRPGQSIRTVLGKLCDKRGISIASVEVFLLGSEKPLDLGEDISTLGSKEVVIERRVLFRLDMPNHKSIGVKAKPNRSIRDVFKPILNKYGYRIDNVGVQLSGMAELLDMDIPVSDIDNQRVIIIINPDAENATDGSMAPPQAALPPRHRRTPHLFSSRVRGGKGGSLEEITNQIFDDLMKGKSELAHTFDELGVVDLERSKGHKNSDEHRSLGLFGLLRKESWGAKDNTKKKGKVTFALPRSDSKKNKHKAEDDRLMELIEQAETEKLEQQRAMAAEAGDYPEFLCTDAVEHVDMATHDEALLKSIGEYDANSGVEGALLPPPDMFDDVHYMHSGSRDNLHLSGRSQDVTAVTPRSSSRGVTDPRGGGRFTGNTPTPTPRGKHNTQESNVGGRPPSTEDSNTYLAMQPVIVDAREGRSQQQQQARQRLDSNSFSKSVMSRFDELRTFSPTKGDVSEVEQAPVATPEGISPRKTPDVCDVRKADFTSPETGRPVPAKRRAWDDHGTQGQSVNSPVAVSPQPATPRQEPGVAGSRTSSSQRLSGAGGGGDGTRNTPVPSSDQGGRQEVFTPRYTSPPPYSTVTSARSTFTLAKPPLSPSYSAGTPLRSSTSPNPPQTYRPNSARDSPYRHSGGFYTTRESLHDPAFQQYGYKVTPIPSRTASFDLINPARGTDSPKHQVMSPRDGNTPTPRDGGITPRRSPQNDYIGSLSFNKSMEQISPKDKLINHYAAEKANVSLTGYSPGRKLQTPDILSSQYSHSVAGLVSPRQLTPPGVKSGQTIAVAVDVHQPKDHDFSPSSAGYTRPLSQTFDAASFSDQTVTFV